MDGGWVGVVVVGGSGWTSGVEESERNHCGSGGGMEERRPCSMAGGSGGGSVGGGGSGWAVCCRTDERRNAGEVARREWLAASAYLSSESGSSLAEYTDILDGWKGCGSDHDILKRESPLRRVGDSYRHAGPCYECDVCVR